MTRIFLVAAVVTAFGSPHDLGPDSFDSFQALILPQPGELAWYEEIPWLTSVQEAREKAASAGKPLLIWCSADGHPCGAT